MLVVCLSSDIICDVRIGLCCVHVVFLAAYPYDFINRNDDASRGGGGGGGGGCGGAHCSD